jgi:hypothetical protein
MNSIVREISICDITQEELSPKVQKVKKFFEDIFNGLEEHESDDYPGDIFYRKNDITYMWQDTKNEILWCSYKDLWSFFETESGYNRNETSNLIQGMVGMYLNIKVFTPACKSYTIFH